MAAIDSRRTGIRARTAVLLALLLAVPMTAALAGAPSAVAEPVSLTLEYRCTFPMIGAQPVTVRIDSDVPSRVEPGTPMPKIEIESVATVNAAATRGFVAVGAATFTGTVAAQSTVRAPGIELPVQIPITAEETEVPATGGFDVRAAGTAPALTFGTPGAGRITVGDLLLTITPRLPDGTLTGLDTFESECVQGEGQNNVLATFQIGNGPDEPGEDRRFTYAFTGSSFLATPGAAAPMTGRLGLTVRADGTVTAAPEIAPTAVDARLLGFLPVRAGLTFTPDAVTTGTLRGGELALTGRTVIGVPSVTLAGIPIGGGPGCRSQQPADLELRSAAAFDPAAGGTLEGTYAIPPLTGCGLLTGVVSDALSGERNTVGLALTPGSAPDADPADAADARDAGSRDPADARDATRGRPVRDVRDVQRAPAVRTAADDAFYEPPVPLPAGRPGDVIRMRPAKAGPPTARGLADAWQVMYLSTDALGAPVAVTGIVLVPRGADRATAPIVGFGPGTTGPAFRCTVSRMVDQGAFYEQPAVNDMLRSGHAVAITDYEGYHPGPQTTYIVGRSMGPALIDVVRAAQRLPEAGLAADAKVLFRGYSQGGGAAMWAGQLQPQYAPELDLVGVVAGGVPADLIQVALPLEGRDGFGFLLNALLGLDNAYPELRLDDYLNDAGRGVLAEMAAGDCTVELLLDHQGGKVADHTTRSPLLQPEWLDRVAQNRLGASGIEVPVFQYHATADEIVDFRQARTLREAYCGRGVALTWRTYDTGHITLVARGNADAMAFIKTRVAGGPATGDC